MSRHRSGAALALTLILSCLTASAASAEQGSRDHLYDSRYCEILVLKGGPPDGKVVVWNTVGLNHCPASKWDSLDGAQLAEELGATAVILNGPRHWLLDSASGSVGRQRSFDGLRARRVATLPIRTAADLSRVPYAERVVDRHNLWHWRGGRTIYELLAPDGSNYVMQAYSQIVDPDLQIGDLPSLGERLDLPKGWQFRARRLNHPLDLRARGEVHILQDELQNTYQLLPSKPKAPKDREVDVSGATKAIGSSGPGTIEDRGTVTGTPFGDGTVAVHATFGPESTMSGTFTIRTGRGRVFGTVDTTYVIAGSRITFDGTSQITGGNRHYRGIQGADLVVHDENTLDGQNGSLTLRGSVRF